MTRNVQLIWADGHVSRNYKTQRLAWASAIKNSPVGRFYTGAHSMTWSNDSEKMIAQPIYDRFDRDRFIGIMVSTTDNGLVYE